MGDVCGVLLWTACLHGCVGGMLVVGCVLACVRACVGVMLLFLLLFLLNNYLKETNVECLLLKENRKNVANRSAQ